MTSVNNLSVPQLKWDAKNRTRDALSTAKVSAQAVLNMAEKRFHEGLLSEERNDLRDAFYKYQLGARCLSTEFII